MNKEQRLYLNQMRTMFGSKAVTAFKKNNPVKNWNHVANAFVWHTTPEGQDFWLHVNRTIEEAHYKWTK